MRFFNEFRKIQHKDTKCGNTYSKGAILIILTNSFLLIVMRLLNEFRKIQHKDTKTRRVDQTYVTDRAPFFVSFCLCV